MAKITAEQNEYRDKLRALLSPGTTVYTTVEHVSRSGMSRRISAYIVDDGGIFDITWMVFRAGIAKLHRDGGLVMGGCGMDMGFALVYNMGQVLYPNGFPCTGSNGWTATGRKAKNPRCLSNDHVNIGGAYRKGRKHKSGGYALNQAWL